MGYKLQWLLPDVPDYLQDRQSLMQLFSLTQDEDVEEILIVLEQNRLIAMVARSGNVLKQFAVHPDYQGRNISVLLVEEMRKRMFAHGILNCLVYTKPDNRVKFVQLGFKVISSAQKAVLLESGQGGLETYLKSLVRCCPKEKEKDGICGCIVMNANPFTKGHRYLVEQALSQCDTLYIIVVQEDRSFFPYSIRKKLIEKGCRDLTGVVILGGSDYVISAATFPKYFIKEADEQAKTQAELDLNLFVTHIAPTLHITKRFVGEEKEDALTAIYNRTMHSVLPSKGIHFSEIPRLKFGNQVISASRVRKAFLENKVEDIVCMVPESTYRFLKSEEAALLKMAELKDINVK